MQAIIDVPSNVAEHAGRMAEAGVKTVIRYYNHHNSVKLPSKCLSHSELQALFEAGLSVGVVFEQGGGANGDIADLDVENAVGDAHRALELAAELGQPQHSAIYFAVDSDYFKRSELDQIAAYFEKVNETVAGNYQIGVYGSGTVGRHLKNLRLVEHVWLAGSIGWAGTRSMLNSGNWSIFQHRLELHSQIGHFGYDGNIINPSEESFGQFGADGVSITARGDGSAALFKVAVRTTLNLRSGPGETFSIIAPIPAGTIVVGRGRDGAWMKVDLEGDGHVDGYMFANFLEAVSGGVPLALTSRDSRIQLRPIDVARAEMNLNVSEMRGAQNNPRIVMYHQTTEGGAAPDETPWCSSFANYCVEQAGLRGTESKRALSWHELPWGHEVTAEPAEGDVVVFRRASQNSAGGHVGFYIGQDRDSIHLLGGNQNNRISIAPFPKNGISGGTRYKLMSIRRGV